MGPWPYPYSDVLQLVPVTAAPVITAMGTTLTLGCNPDPATINAALGTATATGDCAVGVPVTTFLDSPPILGNPCGVQQTRTWSFTGACGNHALNVSRTVTWTVATKPVFDNCPVGGDLGCNPPTIPTCATLPALTAHNECGPLDPSSVSCADGTDTINGCLHTRTLTYTATACGWSTFCYVTYTWNVPAGALTMTCPTAVTVCSVDEVPVAAANIAAFLAQVGASINGACGLVTVTHVGDVGPPCDCPNPYTITRTYKATDACGRTATCTQIITVAAPTSYTVTLSQGLNLIANQLDNGNNDFNVLFSSLPDGAAVYKRVPCPGSYTCYLRDSGVVSGFTSGWTDCNGFEVSPGTLDPGEGAIIDKNWSGSPLSLTFSGTPRCPVLPVQFWFIREVPAWT